MNRSVAIRLLAVLTFLLAFPLGSRGQVPLTLDQVIRQAQDSVITAFQSQYEYESRQASYEAFQALRKPQLSLSIVPNYARYASDLSRNYVDLKNFDMFSTSAQLKLSQKVLPFGGEAYASSQVIWSEFFRSEATGYPRRFVASPLILGYSQPLLGYNPFKWEKKEEDQRLKAAREQHEYNLRCIAEEAAARYIRLVRDQLMLQIRTYELELSDTLLAITRQKALIAVVPLAELHSIEVQQQNAANLLEVAQRDEEKARTEFASLLRLKQLPPDLPLLPIPDTPQPSGLTLEDVAMLASSNSPAYQQQLAELIQARHQEAKARKERGVNVGLDINLGMQQVNASLGGAFKDQRLYALGAVQLTIPIMDHGAAKKRHEAASSWVEREEWALKEIERRLVEDATVTWQKLESSRMRLTSTLKTINLAEEVFNETAENYAHGLCDINTFTLSQNRWATAYTNYLAALEEFWCAYYHLQTLINYE
ncbi:MAG: TolC family protein [Bacteroidales bacterium]|nr:TolC family protein [Bacteroidales bacterium]